MRRKFTLLALLFIALGYNAMAQVNCQFSPSVVNGCASLTVNFTDQSTGGVPPYTHFWDFDGAGTSTAANPSQLFVAPGIYNIRHIVRDATSTDTCFRQIRVFEPPTVNFVSANNQGCGNPCHTVNFTNQTIPGGAPVAEYVWDWGDGTLAESFPPTTPNAAHCYNLQGTHDVTLIARDTNGCQASRVITDFVFIGARPTVNVTATPGSSCTAPQAVSFAASGTSSNGPGLTYTWQFGNGGTAAGANANQVYQTGIYTATVTATDPIGCTQTATRLIQITPVAAGFTVNTTIACNGSPVQFTDTSNFATSWSWTFGDGGTSNQRNPTHTYYQNGTYTITLTATFNGCSNTVTKTAYITVTDGVSASFTADDTSACAAPHTVNFTSVIGPGATGLLWNFGSGNTTSTLPNPTFTYNTNGEFDVTLTVTGASGCTSQIRYNDYIDVGQINAIFTLDSPSGCSPLTVTFDENSTSLYPITSYLWNFGDNTATSTLQNPVHVYTVNGQYTPTLTITNSVGCTRTYTYPGQVNVGGPGNPAFSATPTTQCVKQPISFTDLTTGVNPNATYFWEFGDGGTSTDQNPTYEYNDVGNYTITLTIVYNGCSTQIARNNYITIVVPKAEFGFQFNCNNPTTVAFVDSSLGAQTWLWSFGDGATSTQQNPTHTYATQAAYTVTLTVTNTTTGCVDSLSRVLPIGTPTANFAADTLAGCTNLRVRFTDGSVFASSWLWRFGDGTTSTAQSPLKQYISPGVYTVTLIINPGQACMDSIVKVNYITAYGVTPAFVTVGYDRCSPDQMQFIDSTLSFMGNAVAWVWTFGDGDTSYVQNPTHTLTSPTFFTDFTVRLTVTDNRGCTKSIAAPRRVYNIDPVFSTDTVACPGETVAFIDSTVGTNLSYIWSFGDNTTSTQVNPTHVYTAPGVYSVKLVVSEFNTGCRDSVTYVNVIKVATPVVDFTVDANFKPCPPFPVQFTNFGDRPELEYQWYFGDGDTSTYNNPLHVYDRPGKYTVTLIGVTPSGCTDTTTYFELVYAGGPTGLFTASADSGCVPLIVELSAVVDGTTTDYTLTTGDGTLYPDSLHAYHTYNVPGEYVVTYNLTDSLGCSFPYDFDTIIVGAIPYPNLPTDTVVCKGNYIQFNLTQGDIFSWSATQTQNYLSCTTCPNPLVTAPDTITYYVTATSNLGCSASDTILVNVDPLPPIFPGISFRICPNDTLQLSAGDNVSAATWTPNLFISDTNSVTPVVYPPDSMTYRVTGSNATGCSISRTVRIEVIQKVEANLSFNDTVLCEGGAVQLDLSVLQASYNDTSYLWSPPSYLSSPIIEDPLFNGPHGVYTYTIITRSSTCIPDTDVVNIEVAPKPSVEAGDDQTVAVGTQVQIWAASPNPVNYSWIPAVDSFSCTDCRRPYVTVTQNQTVYAIATNEFGCAAIDSVIFKVVSCDPNSVFVANTFTPNNDDLNDRLFVRGIGLKSLDYFRVFDRWGQVVFETKNLTEGWDGTINGKQCELAVYVYSMKGVCSSGQVMEKSGNVTLVR